MRRGEGSVILLIVLGALGVTLVAALTATKSPPPPLPFPPREAPPSVPPPETPPPREEKKVSFYTAARANLRACPSLFCPVVTTVPQGEKFLLPYETHDDLPEWIKTEGGYLNRIVFSPSEEARATASSSPPREEPPPREIPLSLEPRTIDLRSVAAIRCTFLTSKKDEVTVRGTGLIVHPEGYLLTNRHVIDPAWAAWVSGEEDPGLTLKDDCLVGLLDFPRFLDPAPLPTYPLSPYPYFDVSLTPSNWDFKAEIFFVPPEAGLSDAERASLDFAVLKLKTWNEEKYSGARTIPALHASPLLRTFPLSPYEWVLVPGYAFQFIGPTSLDTFRLLTITYQLSDTLSGDKELMDIPVLLETFTQSPDPEGGRSGSPIFFKGYAVGFHQSVFREDRRVARAVAAPAIVHILRKNNLLDVLEAHR